MQAKTLKDWCNSNLSIASWLRIALRLSPEAQKRGISLVTINDNAQIPEDLLLKINDEIDKMYGKRLPEDFLPKKE